MQSKTKIHTPMIPAQKKNYSDKLKDPRWQKKRLEILERDEWACIYCYDNSSTLHVHHLSYHGDPWEAPNDRLVTVCEKCHEQETLNRKLAENNLCLSLKLQHFSAYEIQLIAEAVNTMPKIKAPPLMACLISWALSSEEVLRDIDRKRMIELGIDDTETPF